MIFKGKEVKIKELGSVEQIDDRNLIVKYKLENGEEEVCIVPIEISKKDVEKLIGYLNDPNKLFDIKPCPGQMFHGYKEYGLYNSTSLIRFYREFYDVISIAHKYTGLLRLQSFLQAKNNGQINEQFLQQADKIDEFVDFFLDFNSKQISPIWKDQRNALGVKYEGAALATVFDGNDTFLPEQSRAEYRVKYSLASGITNLNSLYDYGAYGGMIPCLFIESIYGKKAAEMYRKQDKVCISLQQTIDGLHGSNSQPTDSNKTMEPTPSLDENTPALDERESIDEEKERVIKIEELDFNSMTKSEIEKCLLDEELIVSLINQDYSSNSRYPKMNALLQRARRMQLSDDFFVLFTNGLVSKTLLEKKSLSNSYEQIVFDDTKFNIIATNLSFNSDVIQQFFSDSQTIDILSNMEDIIPACMNQSVTTLSIIFESLSKKEKSIFQTVEFYNKLLSDFDLRRQNGTINSKEYRLLKNDLDDKYGDIVMSHRRIKANLDKIEQFLDSKKKQETEERKQDNSERQDESLEKKEQIQNIARVIKKATEQKAEYEAAKRGYEESSKNHELIHQGNTKSSKEIDIDLDDFEAQERRILNSKHFTEEQKKQMIEDLYSKFDKYTEQNPELMGRQI